MRSRTKSTSLRSARSGPGDPVGQGDRTLSFLFVDYASSQLAFRPRCNVKYSSHPRGAQPYSLTARQECTLSGVSPRGSSHAIPTASSASPLDPLRAPFMKLNAPRGKRPSQAPRSQGTGTSLGLARSIVPSRVSPRLSGRSSIPHGGFGRGCFMAKTTVLAKAQ